MTKLIPTLLMVLAVGLVEASPATFLDAAGRRRTELALAGSVAEVLKKASKHAELEQL